MKYKERFTPSFVLKEIPDAPSTRVRTYANFKINEITSLGLMTLQMNEPVVVHDAYDFVTLQDFEVEFVQNSDEQPLEFSY